MNRRILVLAGLLVLVVLVLGVGADRALVRQAREAETAVITEARETTRLAALSVRAALAKQELAVVAGEPLPGITVSRLLLPSSILIRSGQVRPYGGRSTTELSRLVKSSVAVTPQGLPEAVVAALALGTGAARAEAGDRLLSGGLPVSLSDLAYLCRVLEIEDDRVRVLEARLRRAPQAASLPAMPDFQRTYSAAHGTVEGWTRQGDFGLGYEVPIHVLTADAQIAGRVQPVSTDLGTGGPSQPYLAPVPDVDGLALEIVPDLPQRWPLHLQRAFLWAAVIALLAGIVIASRAVSREAAAVKRERTFLSSVTHELRTPLASIRLFGETLAKGRGDAREYGDLVAQESQRLEALVERVLAVTRMEEAPSFARVRPCDVIDSAVQLMAARAERQGVTLEWSRPPEKGAVVEAHWDEDAVRQALLNLLDNAIRHGNSGGRVSVEMQSADKSMILSVTDDGPGIPKPDRRRIFDRFQRGETDSTGTGLGLFLVEQVAQAHGGRVDLVSDTGGGSTFHLVLPLEPEVQEPSR